MNKCAEQDALQILIFLSLFVTAFFAGNALFALPGSIMPRKSFAHYFIIICFCYAAGGKKLRK